MNHINTLLKNSFKYISTLISAQRTLPIDTSGNEVDISSVNKQLKVTNFASDGSEGLQLYDIEVGASSQIDPLSHLKTFTPTRLVGTVFSGSTKDPNFWDETLVGSGTVAKDGKVALSTGTTANSSVKYCTIRTARKITGSTNEFRCIAALTTDAQTDNIRRVGAFIITDGYFFQVNGTTMQVVTRKGSVDTAVSSGSFNGNYGATFTPSLNTLYRLTIQYTSGAVRFFVNDVLLHKILNSVDGLVGTQNLKACMENINSNGNTTNNVFIVYFASIIRLGALDSESYYKFLGTNATTVLKYGSGRLLRIVNVDNAGSATVYDNTSATGTQIAVIDTAKALGTLNFECPFSDGLTVVVSGGAKLTVIYE